MGSPVINTSFKEIEHLSLRCFGQMVPILQLYKFATPVGMILDHCIRLIHWQSAIRMYYYYYHYHYYHYYYIYIFFLKEGCLDAEEALLEKMTVIQQQSEHACRKPRCTRSKEKYLPEEITWSTGKNNGHPLVLGFWDPKQKTEKCFGTCWQRPSILISDSVTGTLQ